ncbi:MAG: type II secretion system protein [Candidatus Pacebacteria bacterium]|nr:type II secretion system protein [Candidatus Paceibacterota bacterium]
MASSKRKAFTLIELLVVIAIIGILSAIVVISVMDARNDAKNKRMLVELNQIRSIAELIMGDSGSYSDLCDGTDNTLNQYNLKYGEEIENLEESLNNTNGSNPPAACYLGATNQDYCVSIINASGNTVCVSDVGQIGNDTCSLTNLACGQ